MVRHYRFAEYFTIRPGRRRFQEVSAFTLEYLCKLGPDCRLSSVYRVFRSLAGIFRKDAFAGANLRYHNIYPSCIALHDHGPCKRYLSVNPQCIPGTAQRGDLGQFFQKHLIHSHCGFFEYHDRRHIIHGGSTGRESCSPEMGGHHLQNSLGHYGRCD